MLNLYGYVEDVKLLENRAGVELSLRGYNGVIYLHNTESGLNDVYVYLGENDDILSLKGKTLLSTEERIWKDGDVTNSFYVFRTHERAYTLRFCGSSNGYYCESAGVELRHAKDKYDPNKKRLPRALVKDFYGWKVNNSYVTGNGYYLILELEKGIELHTPCYKIPWLIKDNEAAGYTIRSVLGSDNCIVLALENNEGAEVLIPITYNCCDVYLT